MPTVARLVGAYRLLSSLIPFFGCSPYSVSSDERARVGQFKSGCGRITHAAAASGAEPCPAEFVGNPVAHPTATRTFLCPCEFPEQGGRLPR
jgi:hypothetical protein